jgi:hypothetical protein
MNSRLKQIIKNKLSEDLSSVSIIDYNGSIWFIDAKSKYWYLELYKKTKTLWWRLDFFEDFFILFGMEQNEFAPIISEWVEEVLNGKIVSIPRCGAASKRRVEEVLNCEVASTQGSSPCPPQLVELVLNGEVESTPYRMIPCRSEGIEVLDGEIVSVNQSDFEFSRQVEEALHDGIVSTDHDANRFVRMVEESLNDEVVSSTKPVSTHRQKWRQENQVEEILNTKGFSHDIVQEAMVQELIKNMIDNVSPDSDPDYPRVEDVISHHNSSIRE